MNAQIGIHVRGEQGKRHAEKTSQDRIGSEGTGRINRVGVDEIVHHAEENQNHAESEWCTCGYRSHPVDAWTVGPCKPEKTDGKCTCSYHGHRQSCFRWSKPTCRSCDSLVAFVIPQAIANGDEHSYRDAQEGKTADAWRPSTFLLVDDGKCGEEQVERSVNDRPGTQYLVRHLSIESESKENLHVDAEQQNDRFSKQ